MTNGIQKLLSFLLVVVMVLSLAAPALPELKVSATENQSTTDDDLTVGILSDIHVSYDYVDEVYGEVTGYYNGVQPTRFEKALRFLKAQGVEAIVIAGDLQESSGTTEQSMDTQKDWLQTVVDIWFTVFPEEPGDEGYVELIAIYGNHDKILSQNGYWPEEWGTFSPAYTKTVNGYTFVAANFFESPSQQYGPKSAEPLLEDAVEANPDKPVFYIQHSWVGDTVPGWGYGDGEAAYGRTMLAPYHNVVAITGHTHVPLTDEKSIWQGDGGNDGQFTAINAATINYSGLGNKNLDANLYAGTNNDTEHGMVMHVNGSNISIDRYSFNDMTIENSVVSGEAVKIGETWSWDACDITDRPYAYDTRYETANAPVFADDATLAVNTVSDTSAAVTIPSASLTNAPGYSDMIEHYLVEACNPTTGEVEAVGRIATSHHIDDKPDVYQSNYAVTVTGLQPGVNYILKAYAVEFFGKRSEPISVNITTTGERTWYRTGDLNLDGNIDALDMETLNTALANPADYDAAIDVDGNGVNDSRDVTALQAMLDAVVITYPESDDLIDHVSHVTLTSVGTSEDYQPVAYGTGIETGVVNGDSNQSVKTWATNRLGYPVTTIYFDEPVDLSGFTHLTFDTLFENEYTVSESYRKRFLGVSLISGQQEQKASVGSMNFDSAETGWDTKTISLAGLKNIDLTAVTAIRFSHNFEYYEGRFDGVTEHAIYWDNIRGIVVEGKDADMLASSTIIGGENVYGAGYTNHTNVAVSSTGGTLDVVWATEKVINDYVDFTVDMRTPVKTTVNVQPIDADGNVLGNPVSVDSCYIYQSMTIATAGFGLEDGVTASGLRFTYTCDNLLLDNMGARGAKDYDLIGTASSIQKASPSDASTMVLTTEGTNGSNNAIYIYAMPETGVWGGGAKLVYDEPLDLSVNHYLRFDVKLVNAHRDLYLKLFNSNGEEILHLGYKYIHQSYGSDGKGAYVTYEVDLYNTYQVTEEVDGVETTVTRTVTAEELKDIKAIQIAFNLHSDATYDCNGYNNNGAYNDVNAPRQAWIDNVYAVNPYEDMIGASPSIYGVVADKVEPGFVNEIVKDVEGYQNVLHWYSDPNNGGGVKDNSIGGTNLTIASDSVKLNFSSYEYSDFSYVEFAIKHTNTHHDLSINFYDASDNYLGGDSDYRLTLGSDWAEYRIALSDLGITADVISQIARVSVGFNWQKQNISGKTAEEIANLSVGEVYLANLRLGGIDSESADLLDGIVAVDHANTRHWYSKYNSYPGAGWTFGSQHTVDGTGFELYRNDWSQTFGTGYEPREKRLTFATPISLTADDVLRIEVISENFVQNGKLQLVGTDNKTYECFTFSQDGFYTLKVNVADIVSTDATPVAFDPDTVSIKAIQLLTRYTANSSIDTAKPGYIVINNLMAYTPGTSPAVSLDGLDIIGNSSYIVQDNSSAFESSYVFEVLDSFEGREHVIHMYADPANGGGLLATSGYHGAVMTLSDLNTYTGAGVDFVELNMKNTNIYCDNYYIQVLDGSGNELGKIYERMATTNDWSYYRVDLTTLGLTEEELASIATVKVFVQWKNQSTTATNPVAGEVYIDNVSFGSYIDESEDLFDHVARLDNVEWWWSGNNYYDNAGWLMEENENGSYFQIYRVKDKTTTSTGYSPRRQYLYFDKPVTLTDDLVLTITANNTYMGTNTKISLLGDDGNKYGYLLINQTGTHTYEIPVTDLVKLNADTHLTTSETPLDVSSVKIIGAIFHNDFFNGDATKDGSLVMDDFKFTAERVVEEIADDWIKLPIDSGACYGTVTVDTEHTYGDSTESLKYVPASSHYFAFNPEVAVNNGDLDSLSLTGGTLSWYVYFGEQEPKGQICLGNSGSYTSEPYVTYTEVGDGWYQAVIAIDDLASESISARVTRIYLYFPVGYTVWIDQLKFTPA